MEIVRANSYAVSVCPECGGDCEPQLVTLTLRRTKSGFAVVRNVPAEVCQCCGESQFSLSTTGRLMTALQTDRAPDDVVLIPVYDLAASAR
jgi:YgiT-type zinc finger domain-containing protein